MTSPPGPSVLDPATVDAYGELVFGRRLRLHVLLWVADQDEVFNQSQAAAGVGYSSSGEVGKELERLVTLEMVRKFGRPTRVGPQNYARLSDHPGWLIAEGARTAIAATSVDGAGVGAAVDGPAPGPAARRGAGDDGGSQNDEGRVSTIRGHHRDGRS